MTNNTKPPGPATTQISLTQSGKDYYPKYQAIEDRIRAENAVRNMPSARSVVKEIIDEVERGKRNVIWPGMGAGLFRWMVLIVPIWVMDWALGWFFGIGEVERPTF